MRFSTVVVVVIIVILPVIVIKEHHTYRCSEWGVVCMRGGRPLKTRATAHVLPSKLFAIISLASVSPAVL